MVASRDDALLHQVADMLQATVLVLTDRSSELIEQTLKTRFDLVVLDVELIGLNGVEALSILRRIHPKVPVVMVSEKVSPQVESQIAREGAFYHFHKPLYAEDFFKVIQAVEK